MKKYDLKLMFLIIGIISYDYLFWNNKFGVNILLFTALMFTFISIINLFSKKSKFAMITVMGTLVSAILLVINNSATSVFSFIASFIIFLGFLFQSEIKSVLAALPTSIGNFSVAPKLLLSDLKKTIKLPGNSKIVWRLSKLTIIPFLVLIIFYIIFRIANPIFNELMHNITARVVEFFEEIFNNFPWIRFLFILLGIFLISGIIYNGHIKKFANKDISNKDIIFRKRKKQKPEKQRKLKVNPIRLKDETRTGIILIISVNILVIIENIIDINWLWFGFEYKEGMNLSQLVHEGTYLLILSIFLSIGILIYFFRGNQNFYSKNKLLKYGAYFWIVQNIILAASVAIRNYHYINYYGLAYKRIGIIIFLILTILGLILLYIKIREKKSVYYLLRLNSWNIYFIMIFISFFNWDIIIANYNIHKDYRYKIDTQFLLTLSDKTLHIMHENKNKIQSFNPDYYWNVQLDKRINSFIKRNEENKGSDCNIKEIIKNYLFNGTK